MKLSAEPDGFGFFYGWVERNGERVRVDVLPPDHLWRGDIKLKRHDPKAWVLFLDGEEVVRVERREDIHHRVGHRGPAAAARVIDPLLEEVRRIATGSALVGGGSIGRALQKSRKPTFLRL
jgi:hypothetical protein